MSGAEQALANSKARKDMVATTESWWVPPSPAKLPATTEPLFYVVGKHKDQTAYYCGWWHTYGEPLLTHNPSLGAKAMKRAGANRIRRRLENPDIWGGAWKLEKA
jgi:predicted GIY-YIG superfamily endonuclease